MSFGDFALALLAVVIWGANFVVIKLGLAHLPPLTFTLLRFTAAAFPAILFVPRPRVDWRFLLLYGLLQFAVQFSLLFTGLRLGVPAGLASLIVQLQAFFTLGLAVLLLNEKLRPAQIVGSLLAGAGVAVVGWHLSGAATLAGLALVIAAGLCWALANIATRLMGPVQPLPLVVWGSAVAVPPLLAASLLADGGLVQTIGGMGWGGWGAVLFQAYPNTLLGFGIWAFLIRRHSASQIAPFSLLVPVTGMAAAALVLGETVTAWKIAAALMVIGGLGIAQLRWNRIRN